MSGLTESKTMLKSTKSIPEYVSCPFLNLLMLKEPIHFFVRDHKFRKGV